MTPPAGSQQKRCICGNMFYPYKGSKSCSAGCSSARLRKTWNKYYDSNREQIVARRRELRRRHREEAR